MRSRKLLALLFCLITFPAIAGYMTLLGAGVGSIAPVVSWVSGTDAFPSTLSFSRTSNATMFDSTGKLTYAPNNLLMQSNTFSNAAWVKTTATLTSGVADPLGGTTAWTFTANGASSNVYQQYTSVATVNHLTAIYIRRRAGAGAVKIIDASGARQTVSVTGSWAQYSVTALSVSANPFAGVELAISGDAIDVYFATASVVTYETTPRTADQVITTAAAYYGPRIDYDPVTLAVKGLLIEESRTNFAIRSQAFNNAAWSKGANLTVSTGVADPAGGTNAQTLTATATAAWNTTNYIYQGAAASITNGQPATISVYMRRRTGTGTVNLATPNGNSPVSVTLTSSWQRFQVTATATSTTGYVQIDVLTNGDAIDVFGAQLEAGSFATSYIPTAAASVTRAADVVQFTGAALTALQGSAATFIGQTIGLPFNPVANSALVAATPFEADNSIIAYVTNSNAVGVATAATYNGAVALIVGTPNYATAMRIGSAFSGSGRSLVVNGGSVATDANAIGSRPAVYLGGTGASLYLNGWMQSFAIYNQRIPDATLQAKSVVGASYAANDNGLRFADNDNLPIHWRVAL